MSYFKMMASEFFFKLAVDGYDKAFIQNAAFLFFLQDEREAEVWPGLRELSFSEIERMVSLYVKVVRVRPLLPQGVLGAHPTYRWQFPEKPEKVYWIFLSDFLNKEQRLVTFLHEVLHIFFYRELVFFPDEDELTRVAEMLAERHRQKVEALLRDFLK